MNLSDFQKSLTHPKPPGGLSPALTGLWWDAKGDWQKAHEAAQEDEGRDASWVHAYLHRKEGDLPNAGYWYGRAGKPTAQNPLEQEWSDIANSLLG